MVALDQDGGSDSNGKGGKKLDSGYDSEGRTKKIC